MTMSEEINFDGLVGPTHNYAGLAQGNIASSINANQTSYPLRAALQGLGKMRKLHQLGITQGVLPPHPRPHIPTLKQLGFTGSEKQIIERCARHHPLLLNHVSSASSMWAANAATVCPSRDSHDNKVHFTPANLVSQFHRSIEAETTAEILKSLFSNPEHFRHHDPLPQHVNWGDEGAANHTRLCASHESPGLHLWVYGRSQHRPQHQPKQFPARQTHEASEAIARLHGLTEQQTVFAQQNPKVIDQGVFHNDVIAVGSRNLLFYHQEAFIDAAQVIDEITSKLPDVNLHFVEVPSDRISVATAVNTYLFNTQLVSADGEHNLLIAPTECQQSESVNGYLNELVNSPNTPINDVVFIDVKESMQNGGGPACLRLRVVLNSAEKAAMNSSCLLNNERLDSLESWVKKHYRDRLSPDDLRDPQLYEESLVALDELTQLLNLGALYYFQR